MTFRLITRTVMYCGLLSFFIGCSSPRNGKAELSTDETGMEIASLSADFKSYGGPCTGPTAPVIYDGQDIIRYPKRRGNISGSDVSIIKFGNIKLLGSIFIDESFMMIDLKIPELDQSGKVSRYTAYRFNGKYTVERQ